MNELKRGKFLKKLRLENKMTQEELGKMIHYSNKNISKWEQGKAFPSNPSTIIDLAKIFDISPEEILYGKRKK